MSRNFSPRKKRNKTDLSPQQRIISQYFTPRSGISKEDVNFLVKPVKEPKFKQNSVSRKGTGTSEGAKDRSGGHLDQITLPLATTGFTTAAKIHEQAVKCCSNPPQQRSFSDQSTLSSTLGSTSLAASVPSRSPWNSASQSCEDSAYSSSEGKQTLADKPTRVSFLMASSTSDASSSSSYASAAHTSSSKRTSRKVKRNRRRQDRQNLKTLKTQKGLKQTTLISLDSEDGEASSDSDCCIVNVVYNKTANTNPTNGHDSEVEEITSCSLTSCPSSSQSSQDSTRGVNTCTSDSQRSLSCTTESDQRSDILSCEQSAVSFKSARQTKKQSSASTSMYGLVGDDFSESEDDSEDFNVCGTEFSQLPVEIMENIFCQLPIIDLMLNCVLVCRQWNSIISRDSVMIIIQSNFL